MGQFTQIINFIHTYNRYLLLAALAFVLFRSISGWLGKGAYTSADKAAGGALVGFAHLQLVTGLIQYFFLSGYTRLLLEGGMAAAKTSPWAMYFSMEHITSMVIAVVLIQLGRTFSKRKTNATDKHRTVAIYTLIATLLIVGTLAHKGLLIGNIAAG